MLDLSPLLRCEGSEAILHALQILGTDTLKVGIGVLDDEAIDPLGVHDGKTEPTGPPKSRMYAMTSARFAKVGLNWASLG